MKKQAILSWRSRGGWLALVLLLLLALAACSPGSATNTASGPQETGTTTTPAPVNVPPDYEGLIVISFDASVTYEQASAEVESAGLKLQIPCPNAGPIIADATPRPTNQVTTFPDQHQLTATGDPSLTQEMLKQMASQPGVTSVDTLPPVACPLTPIGAGA